MKKSGVIRTVGGSVALVALMISAAPTAGQPPAGPPAPAPPTVGPEPTAPVTVGPWTGYSFFPSAQARGPLVIIPTVSLTAEFNDNVFLDNRRRQSDVITGLTPGLRLVTESERHRFAVGYSFTAEKHLDRSELDEAFKRHDAFAEGNYRVTPALSLTLSDLFVSSTDTNVANPEGVARAGTRAVSNTLTGGLSWQLTRRTTLDAAVTHSLLRFEGPASVDSDRYLLSTSLLHDLTGRLRGLIAYEVGYIDIERQLGTVTHTPRLGATYRITETLTAQASAGPSFAVQNDVMRTTAAVTAGLTQQLKLGAATFGYDRRVSTAGDVGGSTDSQTASGSLVLVGLARNLTLELAPAYTRTEALGAAGTDVDSLTASLRAAYQFNPWLTGLVGYNFFYQESRAAVTRIVTEVDQNRVFLGLQFGLPIRWD